MIPGNARIAALLCSAMLAVGDLAWAQSSGGGGGGSAGGGAAGGVSKGGGTASKSTGAGTSGPSTGAAGKGVGTAGAGSTGIAQPGIANGSPRNTANPPAKPATTATPSADPNSSSNPANNPTVNGNAANSQQQPVKSGGGRRGDGKKDRVTGAANGIDTCMALWEEAVHMTKNEWRAACVRTRHGIESPSASGSTAGMAADGAKVKSRQ